MILYLHGFRSSPQSFKARLLADKMTALGLANQWVCPFLPASPKLAISMAESLVTSIDAQDLTIIGSSLGGFYATWLAEQIGCRAVLLNPAVKPPENLESYIGVSTYFHNNEPFEFKREYIDELRALMVPNLTCPQRYFLIASKGDEVLDWRDMVTHYPGAQQLVLEGSDHGISEFAQYADQVLAFAGVVS